jgi:hypothetical protein
MLTDRTQPGEFRNKKKNLDYLNIKGWGVDADPTNDPVYPMKKRTDEDQEGYTWERPPLQTENTEVLRSVERPNMTATFGTSSPPKGLSGWIRRLAYQYSESSFGRWVPLLIADRVDSVEGVVSDIVKGHELNLLSQRGWEAEWKYNREGVMKKLVIGAAVTGFLMAFFLTRKNASRH